MSRFRVYELCGWAKCLFMVSYLQLRHGYKEILDKTRKFTSTLDTIEARARAR